MAKEKSKKDACYHKVKSRYSVWPSAYASGALVKCRKKGAKNWGNKSESFEINPQKHKEAQKKQKMRNLAIGNENPNEKKVAEKKAGGPKMIGEELNIDLAVDYFFTEGINEDGLEMIIEETGLEKFVEFIEYLTDIEVLTEARAARKARKGAKSYEQVKAEIDAKEKAKAAKRAISVDKTKKATTTAKAKQPEKKPVRDAIARGVFRAVDAYKKGMERHNAAMATAKKAGKVAGKAAGEFAKGAGEGVKTAGKVAKVAYKVASEEVEVSEGDKYDNIGKQAARMSLLNNPGPRSTPEQTAEKKARLEKKRGMKLDDHPQFKKEEVDKRRAPAELVARLSAKREGHMAQDGPNKAAYDAKQRILKKTKDKMTEEIVRSILDEAGKKCWKGYEKTGTQKLFGKTYNRCVKANEEMSIDKQMEISRKYNRMSPEEKKKVNQKAVAGIPKGKPKKDTRTNAKKMEDAYASPRRGPGGATRAD
jgi:hypothetical protein